VQRILQNAIAQKLGTGSEVAIDDKIQQLDLIQDALEKGKVSAAAAATGEPEAAAAESKGAKKKATFSFYKQQDSGDGGAGGGVGVPSELSKKKADLEAAMESAKRELKGQEDMSVERSRQVERAKRELEDTERAKKEASRAVDEAVTQMVTKADDQEEGEGSDSAGQRKFLAEKEKDLGNKAFAGGDYGGAIEHFSRALKLAGPNCIYYTNRAAAYLRASRAAEALKDAEEAVCLDPQYVKALFRRAQALEALNQYTDAVAAYEHGLTVMPESDQLLQGLKSAQQKAEKVSAETKNSSSAASASSPAPASASSAPATSPAPAGGASSDATERDGYVPEYRIEETDEHLVVYVELPDRDHIRGVDLQLFSDSLSLTATPFAPLVLSLPHAVDYEAAKAKFVKKTKTLKITIPRA
jgi:tetratricopeptide (TPR) repeat protein